MKILETERLILRKWKPGDLGPFSRINADERIMEYMLNPLTEEETKAYMDRISKHIDDNGYGQFACEVKNNGEFIGYVGLSIPRFEMDFTPCVEIGWRLASEEWGKGYATEAASAVIKFGFEQISLREILSFIVPGNMRSRRVAEKIGMKFDEKDNFKHPFVPEGHPLSWHFLYRISSF